MSPSPVFQPDSPSPSKVIDLLQKPDLVVFLNDAYSNFSKANKLGPSLMKKLHVEKVLVFTGLLNAFLLVDILFIVLIPTALLICTENTFWDINRDGNFVELFKKSFTLYVKSGMRETVEIDIDTLRNKWGNFFVNEDFKSRFYKFIVDHYLRKFHCFYLLDTSTDRCLHLLNTAQPGEFQTHGGEFGASEEQGSGEGSHGGGQAIELERKNKEKFPWLQKLMLKFHRRQRA